MKLNSFLEFAIAVGIVVWLIGMVMLVLRFSQLYRFRRHAESLPAGSFPDEAMAFDALGSGSDAAKIAGRFVQSFQRADAGHVLSQFNVDRQAGPLVQSLRTSAVGFRASAGLLILMALVVTLLNLQGAVSDLGTTFKQLSDKSRSQSAATDENAVVDRVQQTMGDVASRASDAFRVSGGTILGAFFLLAGALLVDVQARKALRIFLLWAHETYAARIVETAARSSGELKADFGEAVTHFKSLVDSFGGVTEELSGLADFRGELANAVKAISEAVDRLPATIQSNMSTLSTQVTREISEDLRRQYELLKKLLMAYADMGLTVKKVEEFNEKLSNQHQAASDAIVKLGELPANAYNLSVVSGSLASRVAELSNKVDAIPTLDVKTTYSALNSLRDQVGSLDASLTKAQRGMDSRDASIESSLNELRRQTTEAATQNRKEVLDGLKSQAAWLQQRLDGMDSSLKASYMKQLAQIQEQLREIQSRNFLDLFRSHRGTGA